MCSPIRARSKDLVHRPDGGDGQRLPAICSDLGALRETAAGFAWCQSAADNGPGRLWRSVRGFCRRGDCGAVDQPLQWRERLERQRAFALERYTWSARSAEWEGL